MTPWSYLTKAERRRRAGRETTREKRRRMRAEADRQRWRDAEHGTVADVARLGRAIERLTVMAGDG